MLIIKKLIQKRGIFLFLLYLSFIIYQFSFNIYPVFAEDIVITPPTKGYTNLGAFISNVVTALLAVAVIIVLFFILWGAYEWITSGGDKEGISRARNRIIAAIVGLALLGVAFAIYKIAATFLGFDPLKISIPTPPPP